MVMGIPHSDHNLLIMAPTLFTAVLLLYTVLSIDAFAPITVCSHTLSLASSRLSSAKSAAPKSNNSDDESNIIISNTVSRRAAMIHGLVIAGITPFSLFLPAAPANARLEGVNKPELLPSTPDLNVIQVEKFLTKGQEKRMSDLLTKLEADTGYRVRVLCQAYPRTPGLAIRDYWSLGKEGQKDDKYVVLVVDEFGGKGNVLNFNVGEGVKFALPNVFWTRLTSKYGTTFYVKENGIDLAITNAIEAIVTCLRLEEQYCVAVPDEGVSLRSLGM